MRMVAFVAALILIVVALAALTAEGSTIIASPAHPAGWTWDED